MLVRTNLLLEFSPRSDKKLAFYGGTYNRNQRRDMLQKSQTIPTSEGIKKKGFGSPRDKKIRMVPRAGGELRTSERPPISIEKTRGKSPHRLSASTLFREPLLLAHHNPG